MKQGVPIPPLDWRRIFAWLERGESLRDIAVFFDCDPNTITRHARQKLSPARLAHYRELVQRNKNAGRPKAVVQCGTMKGYWRHVNSKEMVCRACLDVHAEENRKKRRRGIS